MKALKLLIATMALLATGVCLAQNLPHKGTSKQNVLKDYGQPIKKHARVGKPPITRWVYPEFEVVFEYNHTVHAYPRRNEIDNLKPNQLAPRSPLK